MYYGDYNENADVDDTVKDILMKHRRRWECEFAADWTIDDLNRMTADGMRHLP